MRTWQTTGSTSGFPWPPPILGSSTTENKSLYMKWFSLSLSLFLLTRPFFFFCPPLLADFSYVRMWGKGKERGKTQKIKLVIESLCNGKKKNTAQPWSLLSSVEIPNNGNSSDNVGKIEFICIIAVFFFFLHAQFFTKIDFWFCPHPNPHTHTPQTLIQTCPFCVILSFHFL